MKKVLCLMLSALVALSAAGCGSTAATSTPSQAAQSQAAGTKTKVSFWHAMGSSNGDRLNELVDRFNKSQDKIEVSRPTKVPMRKKLQNCKPQLPVTMHRTLPRLKEVLLNHLQPTVFLPT